MNIFKNIIFFFFTICIVSCVNRIDVPEDEESKFFIALEMLRGDGRVIADFKNTNNLNGTYPIETPQDATIRVIELVEGVKENQFTFIYDSELNKYIADINEDFLKTGKSYRLEAFIRGSELDEISARTQVPHINKISDFDLIDETEVVDSEGNSFWQGTLGIHITEGVNFEDRFAHLKIDGFRTTREINPNTGEEFLVNGEESRFYDLVDVNVGGVAITDIIHRDGFFIELDELDNNYMEVVIKSNFPITSTNQVTAFLNTNLITVSKEHYDYHMSLHNIKTSQGNVFDENALYISNIDNGLGLFSSCVRSHQMLELK